MQIREFKASYNDMGNNISNSSAKHAHNKNKLEEVVSRIHRKYVASEVKWGKPVGKEYW
jgi:hypothetical protein